MLVTKQLTVAIDFHSIFHYTMEVNGYCQHEGKQMMTIFIYGWTVPLISIIHCVKQLEI